MHLLQAGVDITVIALWLGHESLVTTHQYLEADLKTKERALAALQPPEIIATPFKPPNAWVLHLPGQCAATRESASSARCRGAHAETMEDAIREQSF
jgi:hypothetical protein